MTTIQIIVVLDGLGAHANTGTSDRPEAVRRMAVTTAERELGLPTGTLAPPLAAVVSGPDGASVGSAAPSVGSAPETDPGPGTGPSAAPDTAPGPGTGADAARTRPPHRTRTPARTRTPTPAPARTPPPGPGAGPSVGTSGVPN
ncbi:hypothetical protein ACLB9X_03570 [Streptomyces sp. 5K101]|uniref:hypothetical protein n=1 Tax=Streptomyces sp. 5K101 TaxID=3390037 RepID=UPI003975A12B